MRETDVFDTIAAKKSCRVRHRVSAIVLIFSPVLLSLSLLNNKCSAETKSLPNVVIILTDDQGWGDLSVNGNTNLATPNIDALARAGATLEHFYVCQVCAPTRAEFLTGRYYPRTGVSGVSRGEGRLNPDETTVADLFKAAGYATGAFGKWHNGTQPPYHPNQRGFGEYYGFTSGHWGHYFSPPLDHNGQRVRGKGFIVDDFTEHAMAFIEENQAGPFFCYVPFNTPHSPMMVPDRFYEKFDGKDIGMRHRDPEREDVMMTRAALALCENIDWNVGRILKKLDDLKLGEDTIVIYFSDNGPNSYRFNGGLKGRKGSIDEGGLRSPCYVSWPRNVRAGTTISPVLGAIDLLPTLCDLADIEKPSAKPLDGRSFRSLLLEESADWEPRSLFSIRRNQVSVRTQQFRLDSNGRLFDIVSDPGQRTNVADRHPQLTARLQRDARQHAEQMTVHFKNNSDRPFTVGYGASTTLTARDGIEHGTIKRSSKAPNNSFFTHWTRRQDFITWDIDVGHSGEYEVVVYYTCAAGNEGATLQLSLNGVSSVQAKVVDVFDPPLYDKSKERVANSHYFVKDFRPLHMGTLQLEKGPGTLRLGSLDIQGKQVIDVHSVALNRERNGVD
ncbi:MAG TPA: N-acetylgalactosamine 6-sulfate sulfatase [Planctomycetes bacterium]|nr:N-acetylgalactosamine 6-sulfate sulfatase [Planctomycetota bacterium]